MSFFKKNKFILLLLSAVFIFRLPSLFEPYYYGDEGIYLAIGMALRKGFLLYKEVYDNKPPLIYWTAALANGQLFWFRLFLDVFVLAAIYSFYQTSLIFFNKQKVKVILSTGLFALLTTVRTIEGNIANAELFILFPTMLSFWLYFNDRLLKDKIFLKYFLIGCLLSVGFLFKAPALFDFLAFIFFLVLLSEKKLFSLSKKEFVLFFGYLFPILLISLFFWGRGNFTEFFSSSFTQMFGYLGSWESGSHSFSVWNFLKSGLVVNTFFVFVFCLFIWLKRKIIPKELGFLLVWFIFSLFAATLSGRPYPHYLIQLVPSFCLLAGSCLYLKPKKLLFGPIVLFLLFISALLRYQFWHYPTLSYYHNFLSFALGAKSKTEYFRFFNPNLPVIYQTAEFIVANNQPDGKIFIWADEPSLYPLSRKLPAIPYLVAYHIDALKLMPKTSLEIRQSRPSLIIVDNNYKKFNSLEVILSQDYFKLEQIGNFSVYRLSNLPL